jgi:hypothetical protein
MSIGKGIFSRGSINHLSRFQIFYRKQLCVLFYWCATFVDQDSTNTLKLSIKYTRLEKYCKFLLLHKIFLGEATAIPSKVGALRISVIFGKYMRFLR